MASKLPFPRLELRWRKATTKECRESSLSAASFVCDYVLVLAKRKSGDIRSNGPKGGFAANDVEYVLNTTMRDSEREPVENGVVDTPFRDGVHAQWDSVTLNIPSYAVYGKLSTKVIARR